MITITIKMEELPKLDVNDKQIKIDFNIDSNRVNSTKNEVLMEETLFYTFQSMFNTCERISKQQSKPWYKRIFNV